MNATVDAQVRFERLLEQLKHADPVCRGVAATRLGTLSLNTKEMVTAVESLGLAAMTELTATGSTETHKEMCAAGLALFGRARKDLDPATLRSLEWYGSKFFEC